ncbi:MAG TPA: hypothetical protein VEQ85_02255 [Lacipirellulaceae bacterium]|nr:hypothetical protein [Lacipirellulaceae bacterium]
MTAATRCSTRPARGAARLWCAAAAAMAATFAAAIDARWGSGPWNAAAGAEAAPEPAAAAAPGAEPTSPPRIESQQSVLIVLGAPGTDDYDKAFRDWAERWRAAAHAGGASFTLLGGDADAAEAANGPPADDRTRLQQFLASRAQSDGAAVPPGDAAAAADNAAEPAPLWIVLIGHGSFDGEVAKFNLRGPDVALQELAEWVAPLRGPVAILNCTSASAPLLNAAAGPNRIVVAATKSGHEVNFARFGQYLSAAIAAPEADLDKDGQTSLLEAYLTACRGVAEFYEADQRLATEHALLDDNGDGLGTPATWFRGLRATRRAQAGAALDGVRAHQLHLVPSDRELRMPPELRRRRDELERQIAAERDRKDQLSEEDYYARLEPLLVELARLYATADPSASAAPQEENP